VLEWDGPEAAPRRRVRGGARRPARGRRRQPPLVGLVGKGLTFDAGGLSLKTPAGMETMKNDMAGAAAVLGAAVTVRRRALPVRLLVVVPAAENVPDGLSLRPGEVLTLAGGKTVEVLNTDAEGRLVLADALAFACRRRPDWLIDAATLTSACVMALGREFAGVMATSAPLVDALVQAGGDTFERVWQLPLVEEHRTAVRGELSDLKNVGPREGAALTAAAFLAAAVDDEIPWAHIDLAGPIWADKAGVHGPKGATGYGARLLARAVEILAS
jgi:leucyl aminopeptidase